MASKRTIKTSHNKIIEHWSRNMNEVNFFIDISEANGRCWRCEYESKLERCHIIPHSLGGKDEPDNYVILCKRCHKENPNVSDPSIMWDWLKAHKEGFQDIYWTQRAMKEYEFIYGKTYYEELQAIAAEQEFKNFNAESLFKSKLKQASCHFGQPRMNPATIAGVLRMTIIELKKEPQPNKIIDHEN